MAYKACPDCGCRMYEGYCTSCNEEIFIEEQYLMDGESVPQTIFDIAEGQRQTKRDRERTY